MSEIKVNKVSPATGTAITLGDSGDTFTVPSGATIVNSGTATGFGGGKVLQCLQTMLTSSFTTTTTGGTDVTGLAVTITPSATSSKVLAFVTLSGSQTTANNQQGFYLKRGSTIIGIADSAGSRRSLSQGMNVDHNAHTSSNAWNVLDSPNTTSATVYQVAVSINSATAYINRTESDTDAAAHYRTVSTLTLFEIGA